MLIDRKNYPELDLLLWDYVPQLVTRERAFMTYEHKWEYVDKAKLTDREKKLIDLLTKEYGKGIFLAA